MNSLLLDQPLFDGEPKRVFICSTPRSGSYLLCRLMISAGLGVPHEYFNPINIRQIASRFGLGPAVAGLKWRPPGRKDRLPFIRAERAAERDFLQRYVAAVMPRRCQGGVFAAKIHYEQFAAILDNPVGRRLLDGGGFVYLYREDLLRQAVSIRFAFVTGRWSTDDAVTTPPEPGADLFDVTAIDRLLEMLAQSELGWRLFFARNGIAPLFVSYESLCADPAGVLRRVAGHIGCDPAGLREAHEADGRHAASDPGLPDKETVAQHYLAAIRRRFGDAGIAQSANLSHPKGKAQQQGRA